MPASDLERFVTAQENVYPAALAELRRGRKTGHWIWFVFPQMRGLGRTATADLYGIASREEAAAYLAHPILGPRLGECVQTVLAHKDKAAESIFGFPDVLKFRSCLTLFEAVSAEPVFAEALNAFYEGERDAATLRLLG